MNHAPIKATADEQPFSERINQLSVVSVQLVTPPAVSLMVSYDQAVSEGLITTLISSMFVNQPLSSSEQASRRIHWDPCTPGAASEP